MNDLVLSQVGVSVKEFDGEPMIKDLDLATRLGMTQPRAIRRQIKRLISEGEIQPKETRALRSRAKNNHTSDAYYLNESACLSLCFVSKTDKAREVRQLVKQVFLSWRKGELKPVITKPAIIQRMEMSLEVPIGYYCVLFQSVDIQYIMLKHLDYGKQIVPDKSVGMMWAKYLKENHPRAIELRNKWYEYKYPESWGIYCPYVWIYPTEFMGLFDDWYRSTYLPEYFPRYLKSLIGSGKVDIESVKALVSDLESIKKLPKNTINKVLNKNQLMVQ